MAQLAAADISKWFIPKEPILLKITQNKIDDSDMIHSDGYEFPVSAALYELIAQDVQIPINYKLSLELAGLLLTSAMGGSTPTGSYVHTMASKSLATVDQFPSTSWMLGIDAEIATYYLVKGVIVNELKITMDTPGILSLTGTAFSDGSLTLDDAFVWPTTPTPVNHIKGCQVDFMYGPQAPIACTFQDTGDTVTKTSHGLVDGQRVIFTSIVTTTGIVINKIYFVVTATTHTFQVAATLAGTPLVLTTNGTGYYITLNTKKQLLRGMEFGINNNLDVADGRAIVTSNCTYLTRLRTGKRVYTLTTKVLGHRGDEFWAAWQAKTPLNINLRIEADANSYIDIRARNVTIDNAEEGFDGRDDILDLTWKFFYDGVDTCPLAIVLGNAVAGYLQ